jgi:NAD(P)-dependent dehydrogenase (short-subunit alcohol dehydrogenase family)
LDFLILIERNFIMSNSENPLEKEPKPPFDEEKQQIPGIEAEMETAPDYGEKTYRGSGKLKGKKAVITGGDSGIGRAVALAFAREGADVVISYLNEDEDAEEVTEAGQKCLLIPGDISDEKHCRKIIEQTIDEFGQLDILINNAAFQMSHKGIEDLPSEEIEHTFRTNVFAMFYLCKAALPKMKAGASIINTTSIQAYQPSKNLLAYAATKGAIANFTKAFNEETLEKGIRVNAVAPGPVWTPLIVSTFPKEKIDTFGQDSPMKRPAQPAELAPAFVFLASDEASYISGEILAVTGGKPTA